MGRIMVDEIGGQAGDLSGIGRAPLGLEAALDQPLGSSADHGPCGGGRNGGQALAFQHKVERIDQVGRGIYQRAIEIEDNGANRGHSTSAIVVWSEVDTGLRQENASKQESNARS